MDYAVDSEVASVTVAAVTSAAETAAPGLDTEGSDDMTSRIAGNTFPTSPPPHRCFNLKINLKSLHFMYF